jgi:hypothetical protein
MEGSCDRRNESPGSLEEALVDWCSGNALGSHPAGAQFDLRRETGYFDTSFTPSKEYAKADSRFIAMQSGLVILKGGHHDQAQTQAIFMSTKFFFFKPIYNFGMNIRIFCKFINYLYALRYKSEGRGFDSR